MFAADAETCCVPEFQKSVQKSAVVQQHLQVHSKIVSHSNVIQTSRMAGTSGEIYQYLRFALHGMVENGTRDSVVPTLCKLRQACHGLSDTMPELVQENLREGDPLHRYIRTTDEWKSYDTYCQSKAWGGASVPSMCGFFKHRVLAVLRLNFEVEESREMVEKHGLLWLSKNGYIGQNCIRTLLSIADGLVAAGAAVIAAFSRF